MGKLVKLVAFVPETHADKVRQAIGEAGAGVLGEYDFCTFSTKGIGRFRPRESARPAVGEAGKLEEVSEERVETWCEKDKLDAVVAAIKKAHPYEKVPIDVYYLIHY